MTEEAAYEKGLTDGLKNGCLLHDKIIEEQKKIIDGLYQKLKLAIKRIGFDKSEIMEIICEKRVSEFDAKYLKRIIEEIDDTLKQLTNHIGEKKWK